MATKQAAIKSLERTPWADTPGAAPLGQKCSIRDESSGGVLMGILLWVLFGLIVGVIAKFLMPGGGPRGIIITIVLGIVGALLGGWIASLLGIGDVTGFNVGSMLIAIGGAMLVLVVYQLVMRRR